MRGSEIRNSEQELHQFQMRVGVAGVAVLVAFALLAARFLYLQVLQHDVYKAKAEDNRISIVPVTPNRGLIVDRNGVVIARNYSGYTLEIFPRRVKNMERTIDELSELVEIDAAGRGIRTLSRTASQPGNNLTLTLDMRLQQVAEIAFGERRGALVAIDPASGGILALVSKPGFDPNLFVDGIDPQYWAELNGSIDKPLNNRAISGLYPPGSTIKPYLALAALETGKRTTRASIFDPGYFDFGGRRFRHDKKGRHRTVDMYKSILQACDTYYYHLANDMGIDTIARFLGPFGFGSRSGIDLAGEFTGVLPSPEWKQKRFKRLADQKWFPGETISIGIGQGYHSYTPLQLAQAMAMLAGGGNIYKARLVAHIDHPRNGERPEVPAELLQSVTLKRDNVEFIKRAIAGVNKEGTRARAFAAVTYTVGGKTSTAQVIAMQQYA